MVRYEVVNQKTIIVQVDSDNDDGRLGRSLTPPQKTRELGGGLDGPSLRASSGGLGVGAAGWLRQRCRRDYLKRGPCAPPP